MKCTSFGMRRLLRTDFFSNVHPEEDQKRCGNVTVLGEADRISEQENASSEALREKKNGALMYADLGRTLP
jgi:hypothetical protein